MSTEGSHCWSTEWTLVPQFWITSTRYFKNEVHKSTLQPNSGIRETPHTRGVSYDQCCVCVCVCVFLSFYVHVCANQNSKFRRLSCTETSFYLCVCPCVCACVCACVSVCECVCVNRRSQCKAIRTQKRIFKMAPRSHLKILSHLDAGLCTAPPTGSQSHTQVVVSHTNKW